MGKGQAFQQMVLASIQPQKEMYYTYLNQHGGISEILCIRLKGARHTGIHA